MEMCSKIITRRYYHQWQCFCNLLIHSRMKTDDIWICQYVYLTESTNDFLQFRQELGSNAQNPNTCTFTFLSFFLCQSGVLSAAWFPSENSQFDALCADFVSLYVLSFIGLAPMNGTTHIRATQTRTWWKTISRCSIVSGLELGLSCSKVLASSCGCCCSVELKLFVPHCSQGLDLFFNKASGKRKRPLKVFSRIKLMVNAN